MAIYAMPRNSKDLPAEADYTAETNLYKAVVVFNSALPGVESSYKIVAAAEAGGRIAGFLNSLPEEGQVCVVNAAGGGSMAIAGAPITAGQELEVDANGDLIPLAAGEVVAIAVTDAAVGDRFAVEFSY